MVIFSILQNQMLITFDFGGASLCHEILHFVQKSRFVCFPLSPRVEYGVQ
uniref:Uncharacterized protein n=1 Tax=Candidatus Kentrum sp. UNK TaxID=2126344 RepID=A0A451A746_9GAMM|nr:MAG: hypothetical protein BECKUNK1418G_GA0071005_101935 [Candidatus Kentron sp. UNK]VFK70021.1 MAG: hypothetical protein BECKUNK1418H_GA0071006_102235 [Candidatus Kentron sp. UNK]